jgi:transcriptional regulator with XRE-family HTH domain
MICGNICVAENYPASYLAAVPSFGENLKRIRKRSKLKSKDIAERVDVARSVVSGWENDRRGLPETPTLFKLAKALECSIEELLHGVDAEYEAAAEKRKTEALALFGKKGEIDFDAPGAYDRFNVAEELFAEANSHEERARLVRAIQFALAHARDLPRHSTDQKISAGGVPDVPASERDRISQLEAELSDLKSKWRDVQDVARNLFQIAVAGDEGSAAPGVAAGRGKSSRKAG